MSKHTPEPWKVIMNAPGFNWRVAQTEDRRTDITIGSLAHDDAQRIVACVNALARVTNPGAVPVLINACRHAIERLAALGHTAPGYVQATVDDLNGALRQLDKEATP